MKPAVVWLLIWWVPWMDVLRVAARVESIVPLEANQQDSFLMLGQHDRHGWYS
jgi:hypothetical protein